MSFMVQVMKGIGILVADFLMISSRSHSLRFGSGEVCP
jgi:hypothetical protein